ncbi:tRNA dihydrouridine synthase, partial [Coemansia sp. RSA 486]
SVSVPVLANGGIFSLADAETMYSQTGVDGVMSARGLLKNPAFFAGHEHTPIECVEKYVDRALAYGTPTPILHHHIMYMMESQMSAVERRSFNSMYVSGEIQIVPIGTEASFTRYIAQVKTILNDSGLQHTMHDSGTNFQGDYALVSQVVQKCMESVLENGAPRVLCFVKFGARTDKDYSKELPAAEKVQRYLGAGQ